MKLKELLKNVAVTAFEGPSEVDIVAVDIDSRQVNKGHLFAAIKGTQTDGHIYISKAIELGAAAILCEEMPSDRKAGICYVQVSI